MDQVRDMKNVVPGRKKRKVRIRKKIFGSGERPRLSVFRSNKYIYAQIVNDINGSTVVGLSSLVASCKEKLKGEKDKRKQAKLIGGMLAELARAKGVEQVVFDRSGYRFHGRVKALAEGAREGGLKF
jgi:large subunit ribosomal protein L18